METGGRATTERSGAPSARRRDAQFEASAIQCPRCGSKMARRTARKGRFKGHDFWGCIRYPACRGILRIETGPADPQSDRTASLGAGEILTTRSSKRSSVGAMSPRNQHPSRAGISMMLLAVAAISSAVITWSIVSLGPWPMVTTLKHYASFSSCYAARAVGLAPAVRGAPGYWSGHDPDGNGLACEPEIIRDTPARLISGPPLRISTIRVIDGDTIGFNTGRPNARLIGFNAPETRDAACEQERLLGERAKDRLQELIAEGELEFDYVQCSCRPGTHGTSECNFGRDCATLRSNGRDVGDVLISEGLAERYVCAPTSCPRRRSWC